MQRGLHPSKEAGMRRLTGWFTRAGVVIAAGLSLGITGVVGETFAQSDPMKTDGVKKQETKQDEMKQDGTRRKHNGETKTEGMKKGEREKGEKATMKDDNKMMKQDDTMMMEKQQ